MGPLSITVLILYALTLVGLMFFAGHRLKMLWLYWRSARPAAAAVFPAGTEPMVCVQCPVYNEPLMVVGLLDAVARLAWPQEKLEIQILDDSTDDTPERVAAWLAAHPEWIGRMHHVRRRQRQGYKAGALAYGMTRTRAAFFAVFDADFRPEADFLARMMPEFQAADVGVVQARWEFNNRHRSLLTRFQAVFLDAHFVIEQAARHAAGLFFNFNGTAGIWRRAALEEAGGWTADTVTEDLDASYRAQLQGWRFVYLPDYAVPSELPENLTAFKSQQRRWTKGGIQVARKLLGTILRSDQPARVKREAFCHLTVGLVHPLLVTFSILFVPYLLLVGTNPDGFWLVFSPLTVLVTGGATVSFFILGQFIQRRAWKEVFFWLLLCPFLLAFGLAMSLTCCAAVLEGVFQQGGEFVRTPKGGRAMRTSGIFSGLGSRGWFLLVTLLELTFGAIMLWGSHHFAQGGFELISWVLFVKAGGFLGIALFSTQDLWPSVSRLRAA